MEDRLRHVRRNSSTRARSPLLRLYFLFFFLLFLSSFPRVFFFSPFSPYSRRAWNQRVADRTSCTYVFIHVRQMAYLPSKTTKSKRSICHGTAHKATYTAQRTDHRTHETSAVETLPFGLAYIFIPLLGISSVSTLAYARARNSNSATP